MPGIIKQIKKLCKYDQNKFSTDLEAGTIIKSKYVVNKDGRLYLTGKLIKTERRPYNKTEYLELNYFENVILITEYVEREKKFILLVANNGIIPNSISKYKWSENYLKSNYLDPYVLVKSEYHCQYFYIDKSYKIKFKTFSRIKEFIACPNDFILNEFDALVIDSKCTYYITEHMYTSQKFDINTTDPIYFYDQCVDINGEPVFDPEDDEDDSITFQNYEERGYVLKSKTKLFQGKEMKIKFLK